MYCIIFIYEPEHMHVYICIYLYTHYRSFGASQPIFQPRILSLRSRSSAKMESGHASPFKSHASFLFGASALFVGPLDFTLEVEKPQA